MKIFEDLKIRFRNAYQRKVETFETVSAVYALIELSPADLFVDKLRNSSFRKARRQRSEESGCTGEDT